MREQTSSRSGHEKLPRASFPPCEIAGHFLSILYADEDASAGLCCAEEFHRRGYRVWYDTTASSDCLFTARTRDAIAQCDILLLIYSERAYESAYYWMCYRYADLLQRPRRILHLEEYRPHRSENTAMERHYSLDREEPDLTFYLPRLPENGETGRQTVSDLGAVFTPLGDLLRACYTVNLRSHEAWDGEQRPLPILNDEALSALREKYSQRFRLLPVSFSADYRENREGRAVLAEEKPRAKTEEKCREEKSAQDSRRPFPEDYPYMDEFEYLDSL